MQVAGVQPAGSRGLGSLQLVVSEPKVVQSEGRGAPGKAAAPTSPLTVTSEPVVFRRDGTAVDHRPAHLRQRRASARYREVQDLAPRRRPGREDRD